MVVFGNVYFFLLGTEEIEFSIFNIQNHMYALAVRITLAVYIYIVCTGTCREKVPRFASPSHSSVD